MSIKERKEYNVLFFVVDCLRAHHLGCYEYYRKITPNIDVLAKEGALFKNMIAQSSWTKTSVASILTGTFPPTHRVDNVPDKLPSSSITLAQTLSSSGYYTAYFTSNPYLKKGSGYEKGFKKHFFIEKSDDGRYINNFLISELEDHAEDKFFLYVQYMDGHQPFQVHDKNKGNAYREVIAKYSGGLSSMGNVEIEDEELKMLLELYDDEIKYVDSLIGKVIDKLRKMCIYENTIIIVTSDHGTEFHEHGGLYHGNPKLYDVLIHVPFIINGGGIPRGVKIETQLRSVDIMPTILELLSLNVPKTVQGKSFKDVIFKKDRKDRLAYSDRNTLYPQKRMTSIRTREWKLIQHSRESSNILKNIKTIIRLVHLRDWDFIKIAFKGGLNFIKRSVKHYLSHKKPMQNIELYNLNEDPYERANIAKEKPEIVSKLRTKLETFYNEVSSEDQSKKEYVVYDEEIKKRLKQLGYFD